MSNRDKKRIAKDDVFLKNASRSFTTSAAVTYSLKPPHYNGASVTSHLFDELRFHDLSSQFKNTYVTRLGPRNFDAQALDT